MYEITLTARRIEDGAGPREGHTEVTFKLTTDLALHGLTEDTMRARSDAAVRAITEHGFDRYLGDAYRWSFQVIPV